MKFSHKSTKDLRPRIRGGQIQADIILACSDYIFTFEEKKNKAYLPLQMSRTNKEATTLHIQDSPMFKGSLDRCLI